MDLEDEPPPGPGSPWPLGALVRVPVGEKQRELAEVIGTQEDGTLFVSIPALGHRERAVPVSEVLAPLDFEVDAGGWSDPEQGKEQGNALFRLGDSTAALQCYERALTAMQRDRVCSVGADVVHVLGDGSGDARLGYVTDVNAGGDPSMMLTETDEGGARASTVTVDVSYCAGVPEDAGAVPLDEVHPAFNGATLDAMYLYVGLLNNAAKCLAKKSQPGVALSHSSAAIHILKGLIAEQHASQAALGREGWDRFKTVVANTYVARGHLYVQMSKFRPAMADANVVLSRIDRGNRRAQDLLSKCDRKAAYTQRQNKKLAKDVSRWVQEAMHQNHESGGTADGTAEAKGEDPGGSDDMIMDGGWEEEDASQPGFPGDGFDPAANGQGPDAGTKGSAEDESCCVS